MPWRGIRCWPVRPAKRQRLCFRLGRESPPRCPSLIQPRHKQLGPGLFSMLARELLLSLAQDIINTE